MADLQVKNVPEPLHRKIRAFAKRSGRTVRDVVLEAVRREIEREAFRERLAKRSPVNLGHPAARALEPLANEGLLRLGLPQDRRAYRKTRIASRRPSQSLLDAERGDL